MFAVSMVTTVSVVTWHSITVSSDLIVVVTVVTLSPYYAACSSAHVVRAMLPKAVQQEDE